MSEGTLCYHGSHREEEFLEQQILQRRHNKKKPGNVPSVKHEHRGQHKNFSYFLKHLHWQFCPVPNRCACSYCQARLDTTYQEVCCGSHKGGLGEHTLQEIDHNYQQPVPLRHPGRDIVTVRKHRDVQD